jgi:hypothetical protein
MVGLHTLSLNTDPLQMWRVGEENYIPAINGVGNVW